jgi:hypothetical protein
MPAAIRLSRDRDSREHAKSPSEAVALSLRIFARTHRPREPSRRGPAFHLMPEEAIGTRTDRRVPSVSAHPDRNSKLLRRRLAVLSPGPGAGRHALEGQGSDDGKKWDWVGRFRGASAPLRMIRQPFARGSAVQWLPVETH